MSNWVGQLGKTIRSKIVVKNFVYREAWKNGVNLYLLQDDKNNIITIKSSIKMNSGDCWIIEGKVKRQNTFNNQKQTHITNWTLELQ